MSQHKTFKKAATWVHELTKQLYPVFCANLANFVPFSVCWKKCVPNKLGVLFGTVERNCSEQLRETVRNNDFRRVRNSMGQIVRNTVFGTEKDTCSEQTSLTVRNNPIFVFRTAVPPYIGGTAVRLCTRGKRCKYHTIGCLNTPHTHPL